MSAAPHRLFLALGGNQGEVLATFDWALRELPELGLAPSRTSAAYLTPAMTLTPGEHVQAYWNAVCEAHTHLSPEAALAALHTVEARAGRVRRERWAPRPLDLDLLLYDELERDAAPTIPHPGLAKRVFVLAPLCELAPELMVPGLGKSVRELLAALSPAAREILERRTAWR